MLAGGWLAVVLYRRRSSLLVVTASIGGKIGALAGVLAFVFVTFFTSTFLAIATLVLHQGDQIRAELRSAFDQVSASNPSASTQVISQMIQTPQGLATVVLFSMFVFLVVSLLLSTAGGIFAASLSRRRLR